VIVLGVSRQLHDPAAALLVDGRCVAAAEEERFTRVKHAPRTLPLQAVRCCLEQAGVAPAEVEAIAWPWSHAAWAGRRWAQAWRARDRVGRVWSILRRDRSHLGKAAMAAGLASLGLPMDRLPIQDVEHHLTHAASAHLFSGFPRSAILSIDASGEFDTTWAAATGRSPTPWASSTAPRPTTAGFSRTTANSKRWAWRPTATRRRPT
jgi:carbamoyltransferase